jgi:hypothetical protein
MKQFLWALLLLAAMSPAAAFQVSEDFLLPDGATLTVTVNACAVPGTFSINGYVRNSGDMTWYGMNSSCGFTYSARTGIRMKHT